MNLEDFKSFRRVLKPSGVGSIPTHSRHFLVLFGVVLLALPSVCAGAEEIPGPSPFARAIRSATFPGWGQLTNGKSKKAVVQFTVQSYLLTRLVIESREAGESRREADRLRALDEVAFGGDISLAEAKAEDHFKRRRDLMFWWIVTGFYGALDAYVDGYLGDFDAEIDAGKSLFSNVDPVERRVEIGLRF